MPRRILLLVDDNAADAALLKEALLEASIDVDFNWVENGPKAFDYLLGRGDFVGRSRPDLLLVDINMPIITGHQLHELLRSHAQLQAIKVAFWSISSLKADEDRALRSGAISYLVKPPRYADLLTLARTLGELMERGDAH